MMAVDFGRRIFGLGCVLYAFAATSQESAPAPTSTPAPTPVPSAAASAPTPAPVPSAAAVAAAKAAFVDKMVKQHDFDRGELTALLDQAQIVQSVLDAMSKPAERVVPWFQYRKIFLTEERIAAGAQFWVEHAKDIESVAAQYGVAPEMIVAIVGVETYFGTRMGKYRVLDALATLAFAFPPRATFFSSELEQFVLLAREERFDATAALGSYAGAMGAGQFIPSSFRRYAVDADADGKRDLWNNWDDALGSVANYFKMSGWQTGQPVVQQASRGPKFKGAEPRNSMDLKDTVGSLRREGYVFTTDLPADAPAALFGLEAAGGGSEYWVGFNNFHVITRYNRSPKYALAAYDLGQAIRARYEAKTAVATETGSVER
ncbi:MAG: lytic murein transglycosylase B [Gammaproteobacteria bacterium]